MKQAFVILAVIALASCMGIPKNETQTSTQAQPEQALTGDTFAGTIVTGHMKGAMANPHLLAEVVNADGQKATFNLRKSTNVTDVNGKAISFMHGFKNGKRVEIKFTVKNGQNEALAWHYLD